MAAKITIQDLVEAGVHFGHQVKRWNPKMKEFVYGARNGIYIIDLTKTMRQIASACDFLRETALNGGNVLFVGTKRQAQEIIREAADKTGMFHVSERWLGGTLTNNKTIRKSVNKMREIDRALENDTAKMPKKELASCRRNSQKLHRNLEGIAEMKTMPEAIVVVDVRNEEIAIREARKLNIPIVAIVDTNGDPEAVDYPIPGNDDAIRSIKVIIDVLADAVKDSVEVYRKRTAEEEAERARKKAEEDAERAQKAKEAKEKKEAAKREAGAKRKKVEKKDEAGTEEKPAEAGAEGAAATDAKPTEEASKGEKPKKAAPKAGASRAKKTSGEAKKADEAPVDEAKQSVEF